MPGGLEVDPYYVLEYPDWINVVAVTDRDEILLIRQYRHGIGQTVLELPSGIVDRSESPSQAARRELLEETGHSVGRLELTGVLSANPATHDNRTHCFLATGCRSVAAPRPDPTEDLELVRLPLAELRDLTLRGGLLQALHVGSVFFALSELERRP